MYVCVFGRVLGLMELCIVDRYIDSSPGGY